MRVAIVGAGFSGLAAAHELAAGGAEVHVFEARDRVGGRVWSELMRTPHGDAVIERGAEFILQGYDLLRSYANEFGLELVDTGMSYYLREPRGAGAVDAATMAATGPVIVAATRERAPASIEELLDLLDVPTDLAEAIRCRVEISCALETSLLAADVLTHVASLSPSPSYRLAGGNQSLARALAERLGDRVHLGTAVRSITVDESSVSVRTAGDSERFDRVVLATPLPLVRDLMNSSGLPSWKIDALDRCAYGHAAKLHIPLDRRIGPSATMSVPDRYWSWTADDASGNAPAVLNCFAGSPTALTRLAVDQGPDAWLARVRDVQPELPVAAEGALLTTWSDDPWARGAYSVHGLGFSEGTTAALQRPVGPVHFAGEYTAGAFAGLMEGALRSGLRSADEILAAR